MGKKGRREGETKGKEAAEEGPQSQGKKGARAMDRPRE